MKTAGVEEGFKDPFTMKLFTESHRILSGMGAEIASGLLHKSLLLQSLLKIFNSNFLSLNYPGDSCVNISIFPLCFAYQKIKFIKHFHFITA